MLCCSDAIRGKKFPTCTNHTCNLVRARWTTRSVTNKENASQRARVEGGSCKGMDGEVAGFESGQMLSLDRLLCRNPSTGGKKPSPFLLNYPSPQSLSPDN